MYPKNAASPQRIAIGAVVQISDGAVQTSGVSVSVMPQGGAAGASGGTVAYEQGIVHYIPTQAETNYASFILIAYKTGCIPVSATIVTTASAVAGYAGLDWASINAPTTTVGLTNTTVGVLTTYTGNTPQTGDSFARLGAPAGASTSADIAAIQAKTTNLPAAPASTTNITAGTITTVTNLTNAPTAGDLTATMKASVNAEVVDTLNVDTYAEPGQGSPAATATLVQKIGYIYKAWRNRSTQTATTYKLYADDATTVDQKATVSDDATTFDRNEIATGP